ncbi:hypothetical protein M1146_06150 [Patescibacteria group bacterium]|nr:hypothetical protein [Patescibacteria group bacterium]
MMEAINTVVAIYLKGTSVGSRMARGMLSHTMDTLFVRISPKKESSASASDSTSAPVEVPSEECNEPVNDTGKDKDSEKSEKEQKNENNKEDAGKDAEGKEKTAKQGLMGHIYLLTLSKT